MRIRLLFKRLFIIGLALVFSWGWAMALWAQPVKSGVKGGKGVGNVTSQTEKSGQKDSVPKEGPIVLIGASYARGWNIREIAGMKVINKGVDGNQSFEMLARFQVDVIANKPQAVLIWGFINDIHRSKRDDMQATIVRAKESIKEMVLLAKEHGITPVLATEVTIRGKGGIRNLVAGWVGAILQKESYQEYVNKQVMAVNQWIKEFAREQNVTLLDFQPLLSDGRGVRKEEYATEDGTHISEAGYQKMTSYVKEKMGKDRRK